MVLTKEELISSVGDEVRVLTHLIGKIEESMLEYRPTPKQRTMMELLRYLAAFPTIHIKACVAPAFDMEAFRKDWTEESARVASLGFEQLKAEFARQPVIIADLAGKLTDEELRQDFSMFGSDGSRGLWLVQMLLQHYAAYRMQLFMYLKGAGREELNTMNLWMGVDGPMQPPS